MDLANDEAIMVAVHYGVPSKGEGIPAWLSHLDKLKTREKDERAEVVPHVMRVARYAAELALSIGMTEKQADEIQLATLWHDIGKLEMPDYFFDSEHEATPEDRPHIVSHAENGHRILNGVEGMPEMFLTIAKCHHERYDGHGYLGLKGEDIPFAARIVQIADVFDALKSARNYKKAWPVEKALTKMVSDTLPHRQGRREFDPFLLRQFVRVQKNNLDDSPQSEHILAYERSMPMDDLKYLAEDPGVFIFHDGSREISIGAAGDMQATTIHVSPSGEVLDKVDETYRPR